MPKVKDPKKSKPSGSGSGKGSGTGSGSGKGRPTPPGGTGGKVSPRDGGDKPPQSRLR